MRWRKQRASRKAARLCSARSPLRTDPHPCRRQGEQTLPYTIGEGVPPAAALRTGADTSPHPCAFSRLLAHREFLRPERAATNQTIQRRLPLRTSAAFPRLQVQRSRAPQPATTCTPFGIRPPKFGIHRAPAQAPAHPDIGTLAEASCFEPRGREGKKAAQHVPTPAHRKSHREAGIEACNKTRNFGRVLATPQPGRKARRRLRAKSIARQKTTGRKRRWYAGQLAHVVPLALASRNTHAPQKGRTVEGRKTSRPPKERLSRSGRAETRSV